MSIVRKRSYRKSFMHRVRVADGFSGSRGRRISPHLFQVGMHEPTDQPEQPRPAGSNPGSSCTGRGVVLWSAWNQSTALHILQSGWHLNATRRSRPSSSLRAPAGRQAAHWILSAPLSARSSHGTCRKGSISGSRAVTVSARWNPRFSLSLQAPSIPGSLRMQCPGSSTPCSKTRLLPIFS